MICDACEREITETPSITVNGGWCAPTETYYEMQAPSLCSDCLSREVMIANLGIDPGRDSENLRCHRGGIKYGRDS